MFCCTFFIAITNNIENVLVLFLRVDARSVYIHF